MRRTSWFKDTTMEDMGLQVLEKRSTFSQGFVTASDMQEDSVPENLTTICYSVQIYKIISPLMDPNLQEIPTDYEAGTDFVIRKSTQRCVC